MNPSLLLDISQIPTQLAGLASVTNAIALAMLGFLIPYTIFEKNVQTMKAGGHPEYDGLLVRCLLTMAALLCYQRLFYFVVRGSQIMSFAVLSEEQWGNFLLQSFHGVTAGAPTLNVLLHPINSIQEIILFLSSLIVMVARDVVVLVQGCFLSLLYAFGPIAIVCAVSERTSQVTRGWITNTFQVAFWTFFLRLVVRVWLTLAPVAAYSGAGYGDDYLSVLTVNVSFMLLILGTPSFAAKMLSGENIAALGQVAFASATTVMAAKKLGGGLSIARGLDDYRRTPKKARSFMNHPLPHTATFAFRSLFGDKPKAPEKPKPTKSFDGGSEGGHPVR